jgi:adenosylmethionine-8-amino-7-oxononanoate aminotransferase
VPGYLQGLRRLCDQHGALLIIDEVITGFGRLGTWFAAQHYGVVPDLVTFAKGVTSGYVPMGGVLVGPTVRASLESDPDRFLRTGFTYSGHPSAAAAGLACLQVEATESLRDRAVALGDRLGPGLTALCSEGLVADVRGVAAIWAVDLVDFAADAAFRVTDALRHAGLIVRAVPPRTLALCPPLVMTDAEVDRVVDTLAEVTARSAQR